MAFRIPIVVSQRAADRADFPLRFHLERMGDDYWSNLAWADGGDMRLYDVGGNELPLDTVRIEPGPKTGLIQTRFSLSGSATGLVYLHFGDSSNVVRAPGHASGRYAVWQDFRHSWAGGYDHSDRAGNEADLNPTRPTFVRALKESSRTAEIEGISQGILYDAENDRYIGIGTNALILLNSALDTILLTNNDPAGDAGIVSNKHCSDGCIVGDEVIIPVQDHTDPTTWSTTYLAAFNKTTFEFIRKSADIQANGNSSSIAYCTRDGLLYVTHYTAAGASVVYKYNTNFVLQGTLTMTNTGGAPTPTRIQGITWKNGAFWLSVQTTNTLNRLSYEGDHQGRHFDVADADVYQGCDATPNGIIISHAQGDESGAEIIFVTSNVGAEFLSTSQGILFSDAAISTTWTTGGFATRTGGAASTMGLANYGGSTDSERAVVAHRSTGQWGLWNGSADGWLVTGVAVTGSQEYFVAGDHDETGDVRHLYVDNNVYTDAGMATKPSGTPDTHWNLGSVVTDTQRFLGFMRDWWIRPSAPGSGFMADMYANETDLNFYTVGSVEDLGGGAGASISRMVRIPRIIGRHRRVGL